MRPEGILVVPSSRNIAGSGEYTPKWKFRSLRWIMTACLALLMQLQIPAGAGCTGSKV